MSEKKYIKFGGMEFEQRVSEKEINTFVRKLPKEKKDSLYQTVKALDEAGLIELKNNVNTIDDEMLDEQETNIGKE